jgi:hypothetical protein
VVAALLAGTLALLLAATLLISPGPTLKAQGQLTDPAAIEEKIVPEPSPSALPPAQQPAKPSVPSPSATLPFGGKSIYPGRTLVAYYGTAGTGVLGVLGERSIPAMTRRLRAAAKPFSRPNRPVQIVYELIVTVADPKPGADGDYSHDIDRATVQSFITAAHRNKALLVLDVQPGRADFAVIARRWKWALKDPWVSLALDPEWRMGPRQVPGQVIGSVAAEEVNRVSAWLETLIRAHQLPEKLLILHQFRREMVSGIAGIQDRPHLSLLQHVDGFGTQSQKLDTYAHVERDPQFRMGFKLFYDEDIAIMSPGRVLRLRPAVRFVSYQ